ncbi:MAG: DUF4366 domain-containing protein [Tissierellia bacterium]|nr:DUF4366 domain-containing protein [Tissierellia bacterium]
MQKRLLGVGLVALLLFTIIFPIGVFASTTEEEIQKYENLYEPDGNQEFEDFIKTNDVYLPSGENIPYQEVPKVPNKSNENKVKPVEGGNEKAVNPLATKEHKARGTIIENVDKNNVDLTPKVIPAPTSNAIEPTNKEVPVEQSESEQKNNITEESNSKQEDKEKKTVDFRQFLTFQTKSGKTFHLIVNHGANQENVQLLTEVGEQDLLNMIEDDPSNKMKKEEPKKAEPRKEEPKKDESKETNKKVEKEKSGKGLYFIIGIILLLVVGAGYYFKVYKKEDHELEGNFDELEDDYDEYENDEYEANEHDDYEENDELTVPDEDDFEEE